MRNLVNYFVRVRDNCVQLFESLERFRVIAQSLVDQAQVVDCFNTVSLDTNSFKEKLFGSIEIFLNKETIAFVNEGLRIVSVVLDGDI